MLAMPAAVLVEDILLHKYQDWHGRPHRDEPATSPATHLHGISTVPQRCRHLQPVLAEQVRLEHEVALVSRSSHRLAYALKLLDQTVATDVLQ